jgi:hypothetical protein
VDAAATAAMGKRGNESDYESLRDARISENMVRRTAHASPPHLISIDH